MRECLQQALSRNKVFFFFFLLNKIVLSGKGKASKIYFIMNFVQDLQDRLKAVTRVADDSIDEGYGDSNSINTSSVSLDIASPSLINSVLLNNATDVLARSKDFGLPMQEKLNTLWSTIETFRDQYNILNQKESFHSSLNDMISIRDST